MAHIRLNTHPSQGGQAAPPVIWGAPDPKIRGPVVGTVGDPAKRNAIGVLMGVALFAALDGREQQECPDDEAQPNEPPRQNSRVQSAGFHLFLCRHPVEWIRFTESKPEYQSGGNSDFY